MTAFNTRASFSDATASPVQGRIPANLRRFHAALAKLRTGAYRPRVLFVGDSKTVGAGAGSGPATGSYLYTDGAEPVSKVAHFARRLTERGIPASRQSFFGSSGLPSVAAKLAFDPRLSGLSGWSGGVPSLGGIMWATSGTTPLTFTPQGSVSRLEIFTKQRANDGVLTVTADADPTVLATVTGSPNGGSTADGFVRTVVTLPAAPHAINLQRTSGGYVSVAGVIAQDAGTPAVDVVNGGAYGTTSSTHASAAGAWGPANAFTALVPDLVVVQLGTNDLRNGVAVDGCLANLADIAGKAKAAGADVVLEIPTFGVVNGTDTAERRAALRLGILALGAAQNCVVVDHDARFVSCEAASALGLHRDSVPHETQAGYADEAQALVEAVLF